MDETTAMVLRLADAGLDEHAGLDDDVREAYAVAAAASHVDSVAVLAALVKLWWSAESPETARLVAERAGSLGVAVLPHAALVLGVEWRSDELLGAVLAHRHGGVLLEYAAKHVVDRAWRSEDGDEQQRACAYLPWVRDVEVLSAAMTSEGMTEFCLGAAERLVAVAGLDEARRVAASGAAGFVTAYLSATDVTGGGATR